MRDVFYTILVVWLIWRIFNSISSYKSRTTGTTTNYNSSPGTKEGETKIDYVPPTKKTEGNTDGEYVDFEEIK